GQQIRDDGPQSHLKKSGTPTMGGIIIMVAATIAFVRFADFTSQFWVLITAALGCGLVGFLDDYIKIVFKRSLGLTAIQKLLGQLLFAIIVCALLFNMDHSTVISIPGTSMSFDMG